MRLVLDTNVLVSGLINPSGPPGRIIDLLRGGILDLVVDDRILEEYRDVPRRPSLAPYFHAVDIEVIVEFLTKNSENILVAKQLHGLTDPDDIPFLEVALTAGDPLVTGNAKHFPLDKRHGVVVESPAEFLMRFQLRG
jgi:putative PIN family toxin of toxin-antitoxin system